MGDNPFDQFDAPAGNPFDQFDAQPSRRGRRGPRSPNGSPTAPTRGQGATPDNPIPYGGRAQRGQYIVAGDGVTMLRGNDGVFRRVELPGVNSGGGFNGMTRPAPARPAPPPPQSSGRLPRLTAQGAQDTLATGVDLITNPFAAGATVMRGIAGGADWIGQHIDDPTNISGRVSNFFNRQADSYGPTGAEKGRRYLMNEAAPTTPVERLAYGAGAALPGLALGPGAVVPTALSAGGGYAAGEATRLLPGASEQDAEMASTVGSIAAPGLGMAAPRVRNAFAPAPIDLPAARAQALASLPEPLRALPPEAMARLDADLRAGTRPQDAAVRAVNSTMRQPIPMSRGQVSGLPEQQAVENAYRAGASGRAPAEIAQAQARDAQAAIGQNLEALGQEATGRPIPARGAGAAVTSETLNSMYDNQRQATTNAYAAARNAPPTAAMFPPAERVMLEANLRGALGEFDPVRVPSIFRELDRVQGLQDVTPRELFDMRARLTRLRSSNDPVEGAAAATAVRALDAEIARIEPNMTGDPAAIDLWRAAIRERRQQGDTFESNDRIADLTAREYRSGEPSQAVASEDAGNRIFGVGNSWMNKADLARDLARMRRVLGQDSEGWNALRGEHFRRLMDAGRGPLEAGADTFSGRNFANAWRDARRNANGALRVLYTEEQIAALDRLAFLADRTTSPVQGGRNTSATATTTKALTREGIRRVLGGIPFAGPVLDAILTLPDAANARGSFVNPRPNQGAPRLDRPRGAPLTRQDALALTGPGLIGAGNRQGE